MNEQLHSIASNYLYAVPLAMLISALWFTFEKSKVKHNAKHVIMDNSFFMRNIVFIGVLSFILIFLNKPLPGLEESIIVSPADF
jgi:hypothetical protein